MIFVGLIALIIGLLFAVDFFFFPSIDVENHSDKNAIIQEHNNTKSSEYLNKILKNIN